MRLSEDEKYIRLAIKEAEKAKATGEVPIGCVIVKDGKVIARGHNEVEKRKSSLFHAETVAIQKAQKKVGNWRLDGCTLYSTIEPCCQCAGAISNARISKVVFGGYDRVFGGVESVERILDEKTSYWRAEHTGGVLESECVKLLKDFFAEKRIRNRL